MVNITLIVFYIITIFLISIIFKKFTKENKELLRKIIHIGIGPLIPFAQFLKISQNAALIFTGIISLFIFINYLYKLFPTIEDVDRKSFGTLFYCFSLFILILLFWNKDPSSLMTGFFIMSFGDGLAGLIGKNFNSQSWFILGQRKSILGTMTMFFTCFIIVSSIGYLHQGILFNINFFTIALLGTLLEQVSVIGVDNLVVPIVTGICFNVLITHL